MYCEFDEFDNDSLLCELAACRALQQLELELSYNDLGWGLQALARSRSLHSLKLLGEGVPPLEALAPLLEPGACGLQQLEARFQMPDELVDEKAGCIRNRADSETAGGAAASCYQSSWQEQQALFVQAVEQGLGLGQGELWVGSCCVGHECDEDEGEWHLYGRLEAWARGCSLKLRTTCWTDPPMLD
jgi:hypothetical protein